MGSRLAFFFGVLAVAVLIPTVKSSCDVVDSGMFAAQQTGTNPGPYQWQVAPCKGKELCGAKNYVVQYTQAGGCQGDLLQCPTPPSVTKTKTGFTLNYEWCSHTKQNGEKDVVLTITCGKGPLKLTSQGIDVQGSTQTKFVYTLSMEGECSSFDGGWVFVIIVLVGLFLYFVGGFLFNFFVRKLRGVEAVPNVTFWKDLPYLVKDGFMFVFGRFCGRGGFSTVK